MTELEKKAKVYRESRKDLQYFSEPYKKKIEKAYVDGAKENGVVWHDLRKNPEDLPSRSDENEDESNRVITDKGIGFYHYRKGKWYTSKDREAYLFARNVIAWCEIPKFKGEVKA